MVIISVSPGTATPKIEKYGWTMADTVMALIIRIQSLFLMAIYLMILALETCREMASTAMRAVQTRQLVLMAGSAERCLMTTRAVMLCCVTTKMI